MGSLDGSGMSIFSTDYGAYKAHHLGTAAGTAFLAAQPAFLSHIQLNSRSASGTIAVYDAVSLTGTGLSGTAGSLVAFITLGTQTNTDTPPTYTYKAATYTGLTVCWTGGLDLTVASLP